MMFIPYNCFLLSFEGTEKGLGQLQILAQKLGSANSSCYYTEIQLNIGFKNLLMLANGLDYQTLLKGAALLAQTELKRVA